MSRNKIFCYLIREFLAAKQRLRTQDFCSLVKETAPKLCANDWKKGVQGSQKFLKDRNRITLKLSPESRRVYIYRLPP